MVEPRIRRWARKSATSSEVALPTPQPSIAVSSSKPQPLIFPLDPDQDVAGLGAGDTVLISHFLNDEEAELAFRALMPVDLNGQGEVTWMQMYGVDNKPFARLKFTQAEIEDHSLPIYRYPTNNQHACSTETWSTTTESLKVKVEAACGHSINHCVGNLYRSNNDFIGPHKDKMLDILDGSAIASLSLGASRPVELMSPDGQKQVIPLRPGSLLLIGPKTNETWTHAIPRITQPCGPRISLTLRHMDTYLDLDRDIISGKGSSWTPNSGLPKDLPSWKFQDKNWPAWTHNPEIIPSVVYRKQQILTRQLNSEHTEGGSHFRCLIVPCSDVADIDVLRRKLREEHPEACHIPAAWRCRRSRPQPARPSQASSRRSERNAGHDLQGWFNDGEPILQKEDIDTARDGIFLPLHEAGLNDCAALIVRHWDGQKLGLRRLVEAYRTATLLAIQTLHGGTWTTAPSG